MNLKKLVAAAATASVLTTGAALAQGYPERAVTIIVPYGAGGGVSTNTLALAPHLGEALGQEVVVEHRPGSGGVLGFTRGATAEPDGYTLTMVSPALAAAPLVIEGVEFKPSDFEYIGQVTFVPQVLVVSNDSPYETLDDLVTAMRENPGDITAPKSNGWPSSAIAQTVFLSRAGAEAREVPGYDGGGERMAAILGNHVDFAFLNVTEAVPLHEADQARLLAVAAPSRPASLPDVPTFQEQGIDVGVGVWRTLAAPAGTPDDVLATLREALVEALESDALAADFQEAGLTIDYLSPEDAEKSILGEHEDLRTVLAEAGVELVD